MLRTHPLANIGEGAAAQGNTSMYRGSLYAHVQAGPRSHDWFSEHLEHGSAFCWYASGGSTCSGFHGHLDHHTHGAGGTDRGYYEPIYSMRAYIDDVVMHSFTKNGKGLEQFLAVHDVFRDWVDALGFLTNDKTSVWSSTWAGQQKLEDLAAQHGYGQMTDIRDLGVDIAVRGITKSQTARIRSKVSIERCYRLHRCTGFSMPERQLGALQLVLAKALWGCELVPSTGAILSELGKSISKLVFGPVGGRNQELSLGVFMKAANLNPRYYQASRTVLFWQAWLVDTGGGTRLMQDAWISADEFVTVSAMQDQTTKDSPCSIGLQCEAHCLCWTRGLTTRSCTIAVGAVPVLVNRRDIDIRRTSAQHVTRRLALGSICFGSALLLATQSAPSGGHM
eukprot:1905536-Amphidinium_carterae.1